MSAVPIRCLGGRRSVRNRAALATCAAIVALGMATAACGTTDEASRATLPPLETTTTTSTTTSTIPAERFYTVKSGDILAVIAAEQGVTVDAIVALNDLESPDDIQAGQVLEIPENVRE